MKSHEITMKSPWNPMKSPWNPMKSPWNHHEITMKSPWNPIWWVQSKHNKRTGHLFVVDHFLQCLDRLLRLAYRDRCCECTWCYYNPIGSMYGIYANIWGILMVNVTIYSIHGSYGNGLFAIFMDILWYFGSDVRFSLSDVRCLFLWKLRLKDEFNQTTSCGSNIPEVWLFDPYKQEFSGPMPKGHEFPATERP